MIVELLLGVLFLFLRGVIALFPDGDPPAWVDDGAGMLGQLVGYASGLGAWIPFQLAGTVLAAVLVCMVAGFGIKLVRIVASFLTAGGGSAA